MFGKCRIAGNAECMMTVVVVVVVVVVSVWYF
jgi:hypothetical protein